MIKWFPVERSWREREGGVPLLKLLPLWANLRKVEENEWTVTYWSVDLRGAVLSRSMKKPWNSSAFVYYYDVCRLFKELLSDSPVQMCWQHCPDFPRHKSAALCCSGLVLVTWWWCIPVIHQKTFNSSVSCWGWILRRRSRSEPQKILQVCVVQPPSMTISAISRLWLSIAGWGTV